MSKPQSTYPLRLPTSAEVMRPAKADGTSFNQFVATAVADSRPEYRGVFLLSGAIARILPRSTRS